MLKFKDISIMNADQLKEQLVQLKREQISLRFQKATGQLEKPFRMRGINRDIARVKTMMNSKSSENKS
ncbi:Large ribosomal subunit protein uL29 [Candidatus Liberibacter solanacearum]|uniref:Large ribosomal subunit protein uL29 n=1 Tax=Candidatus Liberibacter solanacearum TaxID=556287 RepID=A0A095BET7_9HYPH|nr:50S ribosomal protein L29 [Candidatus Liberibacter solanacearum]KGB27313.1 50S ribosomal protein L29 [Candidatus Liberibacter solanacearum]KJZ80740.1 50S ribosomal protein L29 [Candidatus Liberibacter solanacearum]KJZ81837.1 LSU ribosomal protein L29p (L35e) [Candidatus Liberibacter solanacearum]KQC48891.1 50S ribosomal protein L29 [Candidatus Liberibacter solanacearum]ONI58543.1 50S ribosomal protein L29 [Candidatus Liberibacter solanacearum]